MQISRIRIKNFRCLADVDVRLDDIVVIIGPNNCGKSAFLDAIRIALARGAGRRESSFAEYDFCMLTEGADPTESEGICIDVELAESQVDEWPEEMVQELTEIVQTDPVDDIDSIRLRITCSYNDVSKTYEADWQFLSLQGEPLSRRNSSSYMLSTFLQYIPVFYLSALRDGAQEFSPRSQFWGRILKAVEIPGDRRQEIEASLESLNHELLQADGRLVEVARRLEGVGNILPGDGGSAVSIRALPLKLWDLMSRSEVVLQGQGADAWFPLPRHGQGVQSLAVLFLFQAFVDHLLAATFKRYSEPILALEEPEAHLHPQAARALWRHVERVRGQKLITSHSPYFIQYVPFNKLRMFRKSGEGTCVYELPRSYTIRIPFKAELAQFCTTYEPKYSCSELNNTLTLIGQMGEEEYRKLVRMYATVEDSASIIARLNEMKSESAFFLSDSELDELETNARRIRGEIFFASCWLLCEGQSDYLYLQRFAEMRGTPLDLSGVSVIDYQNNGSPSSFTRLAKSFGFPWFMVCDGDEAGSNHIMSIRNHGFSDNEITQRIVQLPVRDMELFLIKNGFAQELKEIAVELGAVLKESEGTEQWEEELANYLRSNKHQVAIQLTAKLAETQARSERVPTLIDGLLERVVSSCNA